MHQTNRPRLRHMAQLLIAIAAASTAGAPPLGATQTTNHGIHAVPVPNNKAPAIDGSLEDWDLSGAIFSAYDIEKMSDIYSALTALMYDADNLYVAIRWKDATPMGNSHDPRYQAGRGWAGDAVQLRFKTDCITHITAWYYAPRNEPAMTVSHGKNLTQAFGGGDKQLFSTTGWQLQEDVEMAFQKNADNTGYTQEIKIPWALITAGKKYTAGDRFSLGLEFLWGEADWPAHRYADNLAEGATSREFFWESFNNWGLVMLEAKGNLAKTSSPQTVPEENTTTITTGAVPIEYTLQKNSRVTLAIDDARGRRVRNLIPALPRKAGANTEYWDGLDDSGKPVPPGEYVFKGLIHDGIHARYALSFANPGTPSWSTPDGRGAFYADHSAPQAAAASPDGGIVALACPVGEAGNHLIATDLDGRRIWGINNRNAFDGGRISLATDGATLWVASEGKQSIIYRVELATGRYSPWASTGTDSFAPLDLRVSDEPGMTATKDYAPNLTAIALAPKNNALAAAFARENTIRLYNPATGALLSQISVRSPRALAYTTNGDLIILSENRLHVARNAAAPVVPFNNEIFPGAFALASDRSGNIYLSVRGADQNIKVFSPSGALLREIGARGGRPANGPFNPGALRNPAGLAIDSRGCLWVAEETTNPKRTSVWDAATGKLLHDLSGATYYASAGSLNPYDTTMGFSDNTVYKLDWKNNTFAPVYSLARRDDPADIFPPSVHNLTSRVVKRGDLLYVFTTGNAADCYEVHCTLYDGREWRSAAHIGVVHKNASPKYKHPFFENHENQLYSWTDENGDGLVQQGELRFATLQIDGRRATPRSFYWGQLPGPDGTITYMIANNDSALAQFEITSVNKAGAPVYDITQPRIIRADRPIIGKNESYEGMLMGGAGGRVYINQDPLISIDRDGRVSGGYPNSNISVHGSHKATAARPGYIIGPSSILGTAQIGDPAKGDAGEVFALNGNLGENYLFTQDALYIQTLFRDTRGIFSTPAAAVRGMPMDDITAGGESFGGNFIRTPGGPAFLTLGSTDARVLEITGLESIRRFGGKFTYSSNQYETARKLLAKKIAAAQPPRSIIIGAKPATLPIAPHQVQITGDSENLRLVYTIKSSRKAPRNTGQDERLLFKTGDAVDLMIAPADKPAAALRILMTAKDGRPIAVLNQKTAPGAAPSEKYDFSSPWRTITFDRVVVITDDVPIKITPQKDGYTLEAAIPWRVLGIAPAPGAKLRLDAGVLTGDASSVTTSRRYWCNQNTNLVNDIPGEADLTPELWGTATFE